MSTLFVLIFIATIVYAIVKFIKNKKRGVKMDRKHKLIVLAVAVISFIAVGLTAPKDDDSSSKPSSSKSTSTSKKSSSSIKKESSSSKQESSSSESKSSSSSSSSEQQSSQTSTPPAQQEEQQPVSQPTQDNGEDRTVYVANNGKSNVYWYSTDIMPRNTNKSKIVTMTETEAKQQGKRLSAKD